MSKADCERFNFSNTGATSPELAGQAVAQHNNVSSDAQEGIGSLLQEVAGQAARLSAQAQTEMRQAGKKDGDDGGSVKLQPELQAAWDALSMAWYQLKLRS